MKKMEAYFYYFTIFYLLNYLWIEKYFPIIKELSLVNSLILLLLLKLIMTIPNLFVKKMPRINISILGLFLLTIVIGILSGLVYAYQPIKPILIDLFLFSRFFILYISIQLFVSDTLKKDLIQFFLANLKIIAFVNFILLLINIPMHVFPTLDIRFGFPSQQLLYPHPTYLGTLAFLGWALITDPKDKHYKGMAFLLMLSTMRTKLIIIAVSYSLYNFFKHQMKIPISQKILGILGSLSIVYYFFSDTIYNKMFSQESSARSLIMTTAVKIAKDHFPFGAGFASYGSNTSFTSYSPIYVLYGLSRTYGFLFDSHQYGADSYISMILAQFGIFGCLLYIAMFALIIFNMLNDTIDNKASKRMGLLAFYLILSFFTESVISSGAGIAIFGFISSNTQKLSRKVDF
ncbi:MULTISPECIES: hypothetical protein [unclassified Enterococcus]|jgi:hypothetical protein|uniref:hypothetical protein n=1 Tax=unclassified Enterococcus TaxID=2608891 RepID=UPI003D2A8BEC